MIFLIPKLGKHTFIVLKLNEKALFNEIVPFASFPGKILLMWAKKF